MWLRGQELIKRHRFDKRLGGKTTRILNVFSFELSAGATKKTNTKYSTPYSPLREVVVIGCPPVSSIRFCFLGRRGANNVAPHSEMYRNHNSVINHVHLKLEKTRTNNWCTIVRYSAKLNEENIYRRVPISTTKTRVFISQSWSLSLGSLSILCNMPMHISWYSTHINVSLRTWNTIKVGIIFLFP